MAERGGQPGNTNATKDKRLVADALRRAAAQNPDKLREACIAVLNKAAEGDLAAFSVLGDRLDGKPAQTTTLQGDEDKPLIFERIEQILVDPKETST